MTLVEQLHEIARLVPHVWRRRYDPDAPRAEVVRAGSADGYALWTRPTRIQARLRGVQANLVRAERLSADRLGEPSVWSHRGGGDPDPHVLEFVASVVARRVETIDIPADDVPSDELARAVVAAYRSLPEEDRDPWRQPRVCRTCRQRRPDGRHLVCRTCRRKAA